MSLIMLNALKLLLWGLSMAAFARARNRATSRWAVSVAEDYIGMSLEEYSKVNKIGKRDDA